jgi:hypothetical protein
MRALLVARLFMGITLTGGSDDPTAVEESTLGIDDDVKVSSTTGAIRGVVVDESLVPVASAIVTLVSGKKNTTMNSVGEFISTT